jgi:hypothetical protein
MYQLEFKVMQVLVHLVSMERCLWIKMERLPDQQLVVQILVHLEMWVVALTLVRVEFLEVPPGI